MAASPVLADSSYYISLLRQGQDPLRSLALAAESRDLAICGVVRCEVAVALESPKLRQKFTAFWDVMINVPTDKRLWQDVEQTLWELERAGTIIPVTDAIIACSARRIRAVVLTFDRDLSMIPGARVTDHLEI